MTAGLLLPFKGSHDVSQRFGPAADQVASLEPLAWLLRDAGKPWRANYDPLPGGVELRCHLGVDYSMPVGTKLYAPAPGKITREWWDSRGGRLLELHIPGRRTWIELAHLSEYELREGADVDAGELVALSGRSGKVTGAHVHVEVIHGADRSRYNFARLLAGHDKAGVPWIVPQ